MTNDLLEVKARIKQAVDARDAELREIALLIHANPELAFEEHKAVKWLTAPLKKAGFQMEIGVAGLETAFRAVWEGKPGGPTIALLGEYDALRALGHGCGHNIIGTAAVGAALAIKEAYPNLQGRILVLGTPGEEGGGGKVIMCDKGVFDDVDAAMMCHPSYRTMVLRGGLACTHVTFKFYGKQAHASSAPEKGISALDALINFFATTNSLRQFLKDGTRVHGIITKGGDAPNIVPRYCEAEFLFRAPTIKELDVVREKIFNAARHSAEAVGAQVEIQEGLAYAERNNNVGLAKLFQRNLEHIGVEVSEPPKRGGIGSSDIGNVGRVTATIHPYIKICSEEIATHSPEFCEAACSEESMKGLNQAAKALAMTVVDLCCDTEALKAVREEFINWKMNN